jgi:hypothetical protein
LQEVLSEGVAEDAVDVAVSEAQEILRSFQQRQEAQPQAPSAPVPVPDSAEELAEGFEDA